MDEGWADLVHDLGLDVRALEARQFIVLACCAQLDPNPYAQVTRDGAGGWYCEVVAEHYLPASQWPIDVSFLSASGWTAPVDPRDNWSQVAATPEQAAQLLADALRFGRVCADWQPVVWGTFRFPPPPDDGPGDGPPTGHGPTGLGRRSAPSARRARLRADSSPSHLGDGVRCQSARP